MMIETDQSFRRDLPLGGQNCVRVVHDDANGTATYLGYSKDEKLAELLIEHADLYAVHKLLGDALAAKGPYVDL
ncbi:hypothetical protein [Streptomyces decoyicus]